MDRLNQQAEESQRDQFEAVDDDNVIYQLYDDEWKSEESEATSLHEVPLDYMENEENRHKDTVTNAITEVSNDFLSGRRAHFGSGQPGESDDSHISSDAEFKLVTGTAYYAHYPETAAALSDNDWNPYGTESDTNLSPRTPFLGSSDVKLSASKLLPLMSFNPPLHSSDFNVNSPSTAVHSILDSSANFTDNNDRSEDNALVSLKPDITASLLADSHISDKRSSLQTFMKKPLLEQFDLNKTIRESEFGVPSTKNASYINSSAYNDERDSSHDQWQKAEDDICKLGTYMSVMERAKLQDISKETDFKNYLNNSNCSELSHEEKVDDGRDRMSRKYDRSQNLELIEHKDSSGQRSMIDHMTVSKKSSYMSTVIDYSLLQQDLQDIQDSLHNTLGPEVRQDVTGHANRVKILAQEKTLGSSSSSDNDHDIIPSTTTTPERNSRNRMGWNFDPDADYHRHQHHLDDYVPGITEEAFTADSHRPSDEKKSYNSDGDETRTSGSSERAIDHVAADQVLTEMSQILQLQTSGSYSYSNVGNILPSYENSRQQLESHYQEFNNRGLAEKVYRILTSEDPRSQANGILSEVGAQEMEMRTQFAINLHNRDFNFSSISANLNETSQANLAQFDCVRKQLDLSGLSSAEASRLLDLSCGKRFTALDGMTRFLSSQMTKASERSFNHSLDKIIPQNVVQCYPLLADSKQWDKKGNEREETTVSEGPVEGGTDRSAESKQHENSDDEKQEKTLDRENYKPIQMSNVTGFYEEQQRQSTNPASQSFDDSDSSSGKRREKFRPYRPAGSKEVYYTESDVASMADSTTTMESTHFGSDDARGPLLPSSALGSRQDPPNVVGIYSTRKPLIKLQEGEILSPIQEKSGLDDRESETNQSHKGDKSSDNSKLQGKGSNVSANSVNRKNVSELQQFDGSIHSQKESVAQSKQGNLRERNPSSFHSDLSNHGTDILHSVRSTDRWADSRAVTEDLSRRSIHEDISKNRPVDREGADMEDNFPHQYRSDEFHSLDKHNEDLWSGSYHRRPRDSLMYSGNSGGLYPHQDKNFKPLPRRLYVHHDDGEPKADEKYTYKDLSNMRERSSSAGDIVQSSTSRHYSDRTFKNRLDYNEGPIYSRETHSVPAQRCPTDRNASLPRVHSDEDLYTSMRDALISPAFHRALSPELRQAIENRSPILSQQIERSLRKPPAEPLHHKHRNRDAVLHADRELAQSLSPPTTFLTRETGHAPREHARVDQNRPWSPKLQMRSESHASRQEVMGPDFVHNKSGNLAASQSEMAPKDESPDSDHIISDQDQAPVSLRAQLLTQALTQEKEPNIRPDIALLWEQYKANNESYDSSMNTPRLEAITDLLQNPSPHLVAQGLKEHDEQLIKRQERAELEREKRRMEKWLERHHIQQSSSEEEVSIAYAQLLASKEEERRKRRVAKKKKGKQNTTKSEAFSSDNIPDSLFSIPEDTSFEQSPTKSGLTSSLKQKVPRQSHVIDPNMKKLRERISRQKQKIDKQALKELQRMEKLKKLEHLLVAKKQGEISDQTLEIQLDEISSTSTPDSDNSREGLDRHRVTTPLSDDSTTVKDSSAEMHAQKTEKAMRRREVKAADLEFRGKHNPIRVGKDRNNAHTKTGLQRTNAFGSECQLLKLVKDGYLTPEEAYRLALEREATVEADSSLDSSFKSLSGEQYSNNNGRMHKFYSPYSRDDNYQTKKFHPIPKLKFAPSVSDVMYTQPGYRRYDSAIPRNQPAADYDFNVTGSGPVHSLHNLLHAESREKMAESVPSIPKFVWLGGKKSSGVSSTCSVNQRTSSPSRREKRTSPSRLSPSRHDRGISPTRSHFYSTSHRETCTGCSPPRRQPFHHGSLRYKSYGSENEAPYEKKTLRSRGVAWHIPMDLHPSKWKVPRANTTQALPLQERKSTINGQSKKVAEKSLHVEDLEPLQGWQKERKVDGGWHRQDHPRGISNELWQHILHSDPLASKTNHWEVDPLMDRVQYILSKHTGDSSLEDEKDNMNKKSLSSMSLQEAFLVRKQDFISRCKARQRRLALASKHRKMSEYLSLERDALFKDQVRTLPANLDTHPYSDNLYQPKKRYFSKHEMKEMTKKRYNKLPEVLMKEELDKRSEQCKLNRIRMNIFNKKVQRELLRKKPMRWR